LQVGAWFAIWLHVCRCNTVLKSIKRSFNQVIAGATLRNARPLQMKSLLSTPLRINAPKSNI
jgi:hypothetical protein